MPFEFCFSVVLLKYLIQQTAVFHVVGTACTATQTYRELNTRQCLHVFFSLGSSCVSGNIWQRRSTGVESCIFAPRPGEEHGCILYICKVVQTRCVGRLLCTLRIRSCLTGGAHDFIGNLSTNVDQSRCVRCCVEV